MKQLLHREPVRLYLYGLTAAVVAALVAFGLVTGDQGAAIIGVATAAAAIPAVEAARSQVRPVRKRRD